MVPAGTIPSTVVPTGVVVRKGVVGHVSAGVMCDDGIVMRVTRDMGRGVCVSCVRDVMAVTAGMTAMTPAAMSAPFGEAGCCRREHQCRDRHKSEQLSLRHDHAPLVGLVINGTTTEAPFSGK
jgi:hypothetical protein